MATQSAFAAPGELTRAAEGAASWRAFHLVYHGDRDRLLRELVDPMVAEMLAGGEIASFFFVRYDLGGPHVRLRLLPCPGRGEAAAAGVRRAAARFFARLPSTAPLTAERVHRENRAIIPTDPHAWAEDDIVLPDNSVQERPVWLEVDRYGGPLLFGYSLHTFAISSMDALRFLRRCADPTPAGRLTEASRAFVRHAWGFAQGAEEFLRLVGHAATPPVAGLERFVKAGDEAFERRRDSVCTLVREELAILAGMREPAEGYAPRWTVAARRLGWEIRAAGEATRWRIGSSQLHMTANRLGLRTPEEAYLSRLLWRAARDVADTDAPFWRELWKIRHAREAAEPPLSELAHHALQSFAGRTAAPPRPA